MKTAIICGNGPSYNRVPLNMLTEMPSFGVNYAGFQPTYFVCIDHDILTNHHEKIYDLAAGATIAYLARKEDGSSRLYKLPNIWLVEKDRDVFADEHYFSGLTVVYVALKEAFYLGFEEVLLWGVDFNKEWDHFRPDYPPGDVDRREWRMDQMFYHFQLAAKVYNGSGRRIVNFSNASKLDSIFERGGKEKNANP